MATVHLMTSNVADIDVPSYRLHSTHQVVHPLLDDNDVMMGELWNALHCESDYRDEEYTEERYRDEDPETSQCQQFTP